MPQFRQLILQGLSQRRVSMARAFTAMPPAISIYSFPCWSQTREPAALTGINGAGAKQGTGKRQNLRESYSLT
nr:Uncharacterised protein [Klebsiella pneumoniae]